MLTVQPAADASCVLSYSAAPPITQVMHDQGFDFENYEAVCEAARRHGLELTISGASGVEAERAFGWASVTIRRAETGALSAVEHVSTYLSAEANEAAAADMLYFAVNSAANEMAGHIDQHVRSIEAEEDRLRAVFSTESRASPRR